MTWPLWLVLLHGLLTLAAAGGSACGSKRWADATATPRQVLDCCGDEGTREASVFANWH